jgi:hyaluronoglucosaminidase
MTPDEVEAYNAHSSGTMKLQPFYRNLMDDMAARFYETLSGNKAAVLKASGTYPSLQAPQAQLMFDNDTTTYYHSGAGQRTGHYVAVDMGFVQEVKHLHIIQGRNSVDDVDYYDHAIIEYSLDGDVWTALSDTLVGVYDIIWKGDAVEARYVRMRKLPSPKTNWLAVRSFEINPVEKSLYHIDRNPYTALTTTSAVDVELPIGTTRCVVMLGVINPATNPTCRLYNSDGALLQTVDVHSSLLELDTAEATILRIDGVDTIYEIIPIQ